MEAITISPKKQIHIFFGIYNDKLFVQITNFDPVTRKYEITFETEAPVKSDPKEIDLQNVIQYLFSDKSKKPDVSLFGKSYYPYDGARIDKEKNNFEWCSSVEAIFPKFKRYLFSFMR